MEAKSVSRRYETRRSSRAEKSVAKSRVDWHRTRRSNTLLDSEEDDDTVTSEEEEELETSSEDDVVGKENNESLFNKSKDENLDPAGSPPDVDRGCNGIATEDTEEESINIGKRKRVRTSVMYDSDESDDSDIVRKVNAKCSCITDEEDLSVGQELNMSPAKEASDQKQKRLMKLQELSQRRSTQTSSTGDYYKDNEDDVVTLDDSYNSPLSEAEISDTSDDDSMKDFIVEEEEEGDNLEPENSENESQPQEREQFMPRLLLERHLPNLPRVDPSVHFQRVVKSFLINAIDNTFLISLYEGERQKSYEKDMLTSLHYLDDRFVQPRLENLLARSRWKERYKERVDSYSAICINMGNPVKRSCQACELQRYCKFTVILSGKSYNSETLEVDDFMSHDKQALKIGTTCANRTYVYHNLKHFKYKLYQDCFLVMKNDGLQDEPVEDSVNRIFRELEEDGWIDKQYKALQEYMDSADYFQDEKMD
ncbi:coiled-coil domain-containing protein 82 [Sceloporus undulatus]|uniref:coiled-coil domain-containing protein 82 n=1 Tax=Sceloporus undulatus TaxID=8520 RepID=UPI001C4C7B38|nr:coiled-coil domain-containing protein 82 [Sceloporus undulatus]